MTFEQFQSTRKWSDDLAAAVQSAPWEDDAIANGNLYLDCLFIEAVQPHWPEAVRAQGAWHLLIGNEEWVSDDLSALEQRLYDWAMSEGYGEG